MNRLFASTLWILVATVCAVRAEPVTAVSGVFTVDTTPPTVPVATAPADGDTVVSPFLRLEASAQDALSGVAGYEFELVGIANQDVDTDYAVFRDLDDSVYSWNVRARDAAGNLSDWSSFTCTFGKGDDFDEDGLPDTWEYACFGGLDYSDGTKDSDHDGVTDILEAEADTHGFEFYVTLLPGWNMIALPCDTTTDSAAGLVAAAASPIWIWNAPMLRYGYTTEPKAYEGMWIFAAEETDDIPVSGTPPETNALQLSTGWNLTGSGLPAVLDSVDDIGDVMYWSDGGYTLVLPEDLEFSFLQGYWMYAGTTGPRGLTFSE
jgi:hypothetical protein